MSASYRGRREQPSRRRRRRRGNQLVPMLIAAVVIILVALLVNRNLKSAPEPDPTGSPLPVESSSLPPEETPGESLSPAETAPAETLPAAGEVDPSAWNLLLVNADHPLPEDFTVEVTTLRSGHAIDSRAYPDLQAMMDAARAEGLSPIICSSFRTMEKQQDLFQRQVDAYVSRGYSAEEAAVEAAVWVAIPGTSEHQLGLAVDIVDESYQLLDEAQEQTPVQQWLMAHCQEYGFILRYPTDKSDITGIGYEPWHYRYVGREAAAEIMSRGICLEEYLGET